MDKLIETTLSAGLSGESTTPLQEQLHDKLKETILSGQLATGSKLPATRQLAQQLDISRNTVLAAYDQLTAEGYLESRQGAGTFVSEALPDSFLTISTSKQPEEKNQVRRYTSERYDLGLLSGAPALDQFPKDVWARITSRAWRHADERILRHDDLAGYAPLRAAIAKYLQASRGIKATADQILIFSGLQQGFKLAAECLLSPTDKVILEDPGYSGIRRVAATLQQETLFTPVDASGAAVPVFSGRSMLLISPSRQFPLGITMPLARRMELLEWARTSGSLILEDDYDSEFRYSGRPLNSLQGIDGGQHVIYGGTFSKSMFPALRLGYLVVPEHLLGRLIEHRAAVDSYPSIMPQISLAAFMEEGHFARHIRKLRKTHARRQQVFEQAFHHHLSDFLTLEPTDTGLHMIARPSEKLAAVPDSAIVKVALECGVGAFPLSSTYMETHAETAPENGILVGFASLPDALIETTIVNFATALQTIFA